MINWLSLLFSTSAQNFAQIAAGSTVAEVVPIHALKMFQLYTAITVPHLIVRTHADQSAPLRGTSVRSRYDVQFSDPCIYNKQRMPAAMQDREQAERSRRRAAERAGHSAQQQLVRWCYQARFTAG